MNKVLDELIESVKNGQFLSDGLQKYHNMFGDFFINIIHVGEVSGTLADNLEYLAESLKKRRELESKVKGAMIYPIIIMLATFGLTGGLTFFIFPKILPIFKSLRIELPVITKIFIAVATLMIDHGLFVFGAIIANIIAIWVLLKITAIRYIWHRFIIFLPVAGAMVQNFNIISFIRALSMLLKSGVKIVQALEITGNASGNLVYRRALKTIAVQVGQGDPISKNLANYPSLFPVVFSQMIAVGEETGRLTDTGSYLAEYYETELDNSTKTLSSVLEPLLLVTMGFIVGFVALAIILPIYEVSQGIKIK